MGLGIQKKLALSLSGFLITVFVLIFGFFSSNSTRLTRENIQKQQFAMTELIAHSIDDKLGTYLATITQLSQNVTPDCFLNSEKAQAFLNDHRDLISLFDNGIYLVNQEYAIVAETPYIEGRRGIKVPQLFPFLKDVQKQSFPDISNPYISPKSNAPAIIMVSPVSDINGRHLGFLLGSINLTKDYFVEEIMGYKIGKKGYLYLFNTQRTMILHPDKTRIMKQDVPFGANILYDKAINGFEGSGETINSKGVTQIASFKRLKTVDWILASAYPQEEAYAPIKRFRTYLYSSLMLITLFSVVLVWLLTNRITSSLNSFTRQIYHIRENPEEMHEININSNDEVGLLAATFNDVMQKLHLSQKMLENLSRTDPLTGLFNRRHLEIEAPKLIDLSTREKSSTAVIMVDIDHFKKVNDISGHEAGDAVLIHLAMILQKAVRTYDLVVRYGGEEFLLLLPLITSQGATDIAERIRKSIQDTPITFNNELITITASFGVFTAEDIPNLGNAIALADAALYKAKSSGRNRICLGLSEIDCEQQI
jgi:diguanylate cyclase (GGDEF)-like protein